MQTHICCNDVHLHVQHGNRWKTAHPEDPAKANLQKCDSVIMESDKCPALLRFLGFLSALCLCLHDILILPSNHQKSSKTIKYSAYIYMLLFTSNLCISYVHVQAALPGRSPTGCLLACDVRSQGPSSKKNSQSFPKSKQLSFAQLYTFHIFPLIQLVHCSCSVHISFHCFSCFFIVLVLFYICTFCLCCILLDNVVLLCSRQQNGCLCSGLILPLPLFQEVLPQSTNPVQWVKWLNAPVNLW